MKKMIIVISTIAISACTSYTEEKAKQPVTTQQATVENISPSLFPYLHKYNRQPKPVPQVQE